MAKNNSKQRRAKSRDKKVHRILENNVYTNLYVHRLKPNVGRHSLTNSTPKATKNANRGEFDDHSNVQSALRIHIGQEMIYAAKDLHSRPHGHSSDSDVVSRQKYLDHGIDLTCFDLTLPSWSSDGFHVEYPGSEKLKGFTEIPGDKLQLLHYGLRGKNVIEKRDNPGGNGIARRLNGGFTQGQSGQSNSSLFLTVGANQTLCLPFLQHDTTDKMPNNILKYIGNVLKGLAEYVKDKYPEAFNDYERNMRFGKTFGKQFGEEFEDNMPFEFWELFVESDSVLTRHIDFYNGREEGYNFLVSYSYVIDDNGRKYRVNIIGANRMYVDKSMRDIKELRQLNP